MTTQMYTDHKAVKMVNTETQWQDTSKHKQVLLILVQHILVFVTNWWYEVSTVQVRLYTVHYYFDLGDSILKPNTKQPQLYLNNKCKKFRLWIMKLQGCFCWDITCLTTLGRISCIDHPQHYITHSIVYCCNDSTAHIGFTR